MSQEGKQPKGAKYGLVTWAAGEHDNQTWQLEFHPQKAHKGERREQTPLRYPLTSVSSYICKHTNNKYRYKDKVFKEAKAPIWL